MSDVSSKRRLPKRLLYGLLLLIFSSSAFGLFAELETVYWLKAYLLLLVLQGGFLLIYLSFYRLPGRRRLLLKTPFRKDS